MPKKQKVKSPRGVGKGEKEYCTKHGLNHGQKYQSCKPKKPVDDCKCHEETGPTHCGRCVGEKPVECTCHCHIPSEGRMIVHVCGVCNFNNGKHCHPPRQCTCDLSFDNSHESDCVVVEEAEKQAPCWCGRSVCEYLDGYKQAKCEAFLHQRIRNSLFNDYLDSLKETPDKEPAEGWEEEWDKTFTYAFTETDFLRDYQTRVDLVKQIKSFIRSLLEKEYEQGHKQGYDEGVLLGELTRYTLEDVTRAVEQAKAEEARRIVEAVDDILDAHDTSCPSEKTYLLKDCECFYKDWDSYKKKLLKV